MPGKIKISCNDGDAFEIPPEYCVKSGTLKNFLDDPCPGDIIPLPNVTGKIFAMVMEYIKIEKDDEEELNKFLDMDLTTLYDLILAANYLDIKELLDITCRKVAQLIKGKKPEEIRQILKIKNDYTPEEEEEIRREHQWLFD